MTANLDQPQGNIQRRCARCGVDIEHRDRRSRHCSPRCRDRDYENAAVGTIRQCAYCTTDFAPTKGTQRYCSKGCRDRSDRERNREEYNRRNHDRRARERGAAVDGESFTREEIFNRDRYVCQLCFLPINWLLKGRHPMAASLDHIVPLNKGGKHERSNVWTVHFTCNASKGDRMIDATPVPDHDPEWWRLKR